LSLFILQLVFVNISKGVCDVQVDVLDMLGWFHIADVVWWAETALPFDASQVLNMRSSADFLRVILCIFHSFKSNVFREFCWYFGLCVFCIQCTVLAILFVDRECVLHVLRSFYWVLSAGGQAKLEDGLESPLLLGNLYTMST